MEISQIFSLVLLGIVSVIMFLSIIMGIVRGGKKSLLALGWQVVLLIILFFLSGVITKAVSKIDISFLNIAIEGTKIKHISDIGAVIFESLDVKDLTVATELLISIPLMIVNVFVFSLLFFVLRILTWPLFIIVSNLVFKRYRKAKKEWKKAGKPDKPVINGVVMPTKPKVKRGWGALVGVASGILICFVSLMPLMGVNNYVQMAQNTKISTELATKINNDVIKETSTLLINDNALYAQDEKISLIEAFVDSEVCEYLNIYETSPVGKVFDTIGINKLGSLTFNGLTKMRVNGETISLKKELDNILAIYEKVEVLLVQYDLLNANEESFKNFTQSDWSDIISSSRFVLNKAFESKVVSVIVNNYFGDAIKIAADEFLNEKIEEEVDELIVQQICYTGIDYLVQLGNNHEVSKFLYSELDKVLQTCEIVNNYNLLNPIINNNYSKVLPSSIKNLSIYENDLIKDFDLFVTYMNSQPSEQYEANKYINTLSKNLSECVLSFSLLNDLLPKIEEVAFRTAYKTLKTTEEFNSVYSSAYLDGSAKFNINSSIELFKGMNSGFFENENLNILNIIFNIGYNYDEINTLVELIKKDNDNKVEDVVKFVNENEYLKKLLVDIGRVVDTVVRSDALPSTAEEGFIDEANIKINEAIEDSYNSDKKMCDAVISVVNSAAQKTKDGECAILMLTITDSFIKAFDTIQKLSNITEITEDVKIEDIASVIQDITSGDNKLIENTDIANMLDTALDSIVEDNSQSILNDKVNPSDPSSSTVAQTIINNISTNKNLNWEEEGKLVDDIVNKAIKLSNNSGTINTKDTAQEIVDYLNDLEVEDEQTNEITSKSNIITPELITYFKNYLDKAYINPVG